MRRNADACLCGPPSTVEMEFRLIHTDGKARVAQLSTDHGVIDTPVFMPVGTAATVKGISPRILTEEIDSQVLLGNTYHLYLRPGASVVQAAGGMHRFMAWPRPILTDSGGYQVFSLAARCKVTDEGATFQSHLDGSRHLFTPESVIDTQRSLGSDIMMVLDECPPAGVPEERAAQACTRTLQWAERSLVRYRQTTPRYGHAQALFAIVQGGTHPALRLRCARALMSMNFPGYAIGGLSVGETSEAMYAITDLVAGALPADKPRYLMGVGTPADLLESVARGVDMFDCVMPTRNGRNGMIFTTQGIINIRNKRWKTDFSPLDPGLDHYASRTFSKGYVRHLFQAREMLGLQVASIQNLLFYHWLMRGARAAILDNGFAAFQAATQTQVSRRL